MESRIIIIVIIFMDAVVVSIANLFTFYELKYWDRHLYIHFFLVVYNTEMPRNVHLTFNVHAHMFTLASTCLNHSIYIFLFFSRHNCRLVYPIIPWFQCYCYRYFTSCIREFIVWHIEDLNGIYALSYPTCALSLVA